jgi:anti-anti-sigma factor
MSDAVPWRDYARSRAVLIGAWDYSHLSPVPAARNSLERMSGLLTGPLCGWPASRVKVVRNAARRGVLPDLLMTLFDGIADVALFYFVGHGQLHDDELCLALRESPERGARRLTIGLQLSDVRAALRECDAKTKIVILDCCFAGHAALPGHNMAGGSAKVIDMTAGMGAFTIAASGAYRTAWFENDPDTASPQTYFTKYLVDTIENGLPGAGETLTLGAIYAQTADTLARDHRPAPTRSVRHDADNFVLARNIAAVTRGRWLEINAYRVANCAVVKIRGDVNADSAPVLRQCLGQLVEEGNYKIILDLENVGIIDTTGIGVLLGGLKKVRAHDGSISIACTLEGVLKVFRIAGLTKSFGIFGTVDAAVASLSS